jgi:hypothetical protein
VLREVAALEEQEGGNHAPRPPELDRELHVPPFELGETRAALDARRCHAAGEAAGGPTDGTG